MKSVFLSPVVVVPFNDVEICKSLGDREGIITARLVYVNCLNSHQSP